MLANRPPYIGARRRGRGQRRYEMEEAVRARRLGHHEKGERGAACARRRRDALGAVADGGQPRGVPARWPDGFDTVEERIGYRVRPAWIFRRKRYGRIELIVVVKNDGVAGVPGILRLFVESGKKKVKMSGSLDPGQPYAGKVRQASFLLPEGVDYEGLTIRAEIERFQGQPRRRRRTGESGPSLEPGRWVRKDG